IGGFMSINRDLVEILLEYLARIIRLVDSLLNIIAVRRIGYQLLRAVISAGIIDVVVKSEERNIDFGHKFQIALKDMRESNYGLSLLAKAEIIKADRLKDLIE